MYALILFKSVKEFWKILHKTREGQFIRETARKFRSYFYFKQKMLQYRDYVTYSLGHGRDRSIHYHKLKSWTNWLKPADLLSHFILIFSI